METKYIKYFLQICHDRSFSKAAQNLYISQQGLSSIIKRMEKEFEIPLFQRSHHGIELTPYGVYVRDQLEDIWKIENDMKKTLNIMKQGYISILKIAVSFGVISALPENYLDDFEKQYPKIHLQLTEYDDAECENVLLQGSADLGFNIAPIENTCFHTHAIVKDRMCALVNEKHPLAQKEQIDFCDLKDADFLLLSNKFKLRRIFNQKCELVGLTPNIKLETLDMALIHNFSRMNKGIGISVHFIGNDLANVKAIPFADPECAWEVCACLPKKKTLSPAVAAFWNYILSKPYFSREK